MSDQTPRPWEQARPEREGVWNPNSEGEQPFVPGGNAKDHAREKQPVIAYACMYPKLAVIAREHGYALAMHGSLVADCDLIAVPWVAEAQPHDVLADALAKRVGGYLILDTYEGRPAGVRKHVIHLGGGPYIDLAVFPRASQEARIAALEAEVERQKALVLAQTRLGSEAFDRALRAEARLAALEVAAQIATELLDRIASGRKCSIGSIDNVREARFDVEEIARYRAALTPAPRQQEPKA